MITTGRALEVLTFQLCQLQCNRSEYGLSTASEDRIKLKGNLENSSNYNQPVCAKLSIRKL